MLLLFYDCTKFDSNFSFAIYYFVFLFRAALYGLLLELSNVRCHNELFQVVPGSTVVEHLTHNPKTESLNPTTGNVTEKKVNNLELP